MKYAQEGLGEFWKFKGRQYRSKRFVDVVTCAYCRGSGVDTKYGNTSRCPFVAAEARLGSHHPL